MTFTLYAFVVLAVAVVAMRLLPAGWPRQIALAVANLVLMVYLARGYTVMLLVVLGIVWLLLRRGQRISPERLWGIIGLMVLLMMRPKIAHLLPATMKQWPATLGLSYLAFCVIGLAIDRRRGQVGPVRLADFWNWISFFPSFTAGPIRRFAPLAEQLRHGGRENLSWGVVRIATGAFKRVVLVGLAAPLAGFLNEPITDWPLLVVAVYAYTLNIYLEFSAYTDIAVGAAAMMGLRIEENFRWPYLATNISAFWKRWHMSLTGWLRDYLFIPLGGSRGSFVRTAVNTVIVMTIIGLWHGLEMNFLLWGLYHAAGLLIYRLYVRVVRRGNREIRPGRWRRFGAWLLTFHFVALGWVLFACPLGRALQVLYILFTGGW